METLEYAEKNKHNRELIDQILDKARLRKGLSHREAAVLLDCDLEDKNQEIYALAEQIKKDFYGNRIVLFCASVSFPTTVSTAVSTVHITPRTNISQGKNLTQEEIRREVIALQDMGHKRPGPGDRRGSGE